MSAGKFFVYDPSPALPDDVGQVVAGGYPGPTLYGEFRTVEAAASFANVAHPDDSSGNARILREVGE